MIKVFKILYCTTTTIFLGKILKENSLRVLFDSIVESYIFHFVIFHSTKFNKSKGFAAYLLLLLNISAQNLHKFCNHIYI